jgi:Swt1-like HEPN/NPCBM/NEW2 domain
MRPSAPTSCSRLHGRAAGILTPLAWEATVVLTNRDRIGRGFELLAEGLAPFVENHIKGIVPGGIDWLTWLSKRLYPNNPKMKVSRTDPLILLRAMIQEESAFKATLSRSEQSYVQELWECRNSWAHNAVFDEGDTNRLLDTMERLLRAIGATFEADEVRNLLKGRDATIGAKIGDVRTDARTSDNVFQVRKNVRFIRSSQIIALIMITLWIALSSAMFGALPSGTSSEKALIISASAALAVGVVAGCGALHNTIRFAITAVSVCLTVILLASLSIVVRSQAQANRTTGNGAVGHAATGRSNQQPSNTPSETVSSPNEQPETSESATKSAIIRRSVNPLYLSSLTGSTAGYDTDPPELGSWSISSVDYSHSLGYPDLCLTGYITFEFAPSYQYFEATVGIADGADPSDQSTPVDFEVDTGSGTELGSTAAQYGHPASIKVNIAGVSSVTLDTSASTCFNTGDNDSIAVWGNAELIP